MQANATRLPPLCTTRLGLIVVTVAVTIGCCATLSIAQPRGSTIPVWLWMASLASCCFGGIAGMLTLRTLRTLETELRGPVDAPESITRLRSIVASDPIVSTWNRVIEHIQTKRDPETRETATLDEQSITLTRSMRAMPVAWIITDENARVRYISPLACGLLNVDDADKATDDDLLEMLGIADDRNDRDHQASEASASISRTQIFSSIRSISAVIDTLPCNDNIAIRLTRTQLHGRSGDRQGMVWTLTDISTHESALRSRDEFLMTATHELRTPLSNLQASAELLVTHDDLSVEDQKEFCSQIQSESFRLGRLIDDLLSVSQLEAGSIVTHDRELDPLPIIEDVCKTNRSTAEAKAIELAVEIPSKLPTVRGDRDKLQAALTNVLGNAIKYTQTQGHVHLACHVDGAQLIISITDDGPGIAKNERESVFEKFYRVGSADKIEQRGNGLGLAFARQIARLHHGDLLLESEVGEGSKFTFNLPVYGLARSGV